MSRRSLLLLAALSSTILAAQPAADIAPIINDNHFEAKDTIRGYWHPNVHLMKRTPGGNVKTADNGRSGTCLNFQNTGDNSLSCVYSEALIPLNLPKDTLRLTVYAKGKGKLSFALYAYDKNMGYLTTRRLKQFQLDSPQWQALTVTFKATDLPPKTHGVRINFQVHGKADICLDDFFGTRTTHFP